MIILRPSVLSSRTPSRLRSRRLRWIGVAVVLSIGLHVGAIVLLTAAHRLPGSAAPPVQGTVELLMVEKKGAAASQGGPPPTPPQAEVKPKVEQKPEKAASPPPPSAPAPVAQKGEVPSPAAPPPEPAKPQPPQPQPRQPTPPEPTQTAEKPQPAPPVQPTPPSPQKAPVFDFSGTDSPSNAEVTGGDILPASPDNRFRNRPPPYPMNAAQRGEHGWVTVMIHVAADGSATGADLVESSGYPTLDQAALTAVRAWHFHPAMRDSQPVPFDMPFRFDFREN